MAIKKLLFLPVVLTLLIITGCEKEENLPRTSLLKMRWIESYEEKTSEEIQIYRPGKLADFPSSWYRQVFHFGDNNAGEYRVLAPDDGHYMASGSWDYNEKTKILTIYNSESEMIYEFLVLELTDQILQLKAIN